MEIKVPVPVEKIVERTVVQEVEVIREVPVPVEKIVERVVTKEVKNCKSCEPPTLMVLLFITAGRITKLCAGGDGVL